MTRPKAVGVCLAGTTAAVIVALSFVVQGQSDAAASPPREAPTGFDNLTNGFISQAEFDAALATFEERDPIDEGLGPVYNAQSCAECHQNPVTGGVSQISELRAGHRNSSGIFVDAPGGSLINDRAINAAIQERVPDGENVRTFRMSTNVLGMGFVEAINSNTLIAIANSQPGQSNGRISGDFIQVPVLESPGAERTGRFGWKNQHASLLSFAADAYLNEIGITSRLAPTENTSLGASVARFDTVPDPEDNDNDIDSFANFMRATKAPPRDAARAATSDAVAGGNLFNQIGCSVCHVGSITTADVGTSINGGALIVGAALGNKIIHPYSDFLLHDVGTGDGIVQNGGQSTANKLRTIPLWGVRTHDRHMHDGASLTLGAAILRHAGEATGVTNSFRALSGTQQNQIIAFLRSL
jgi:CxxC motif-containing protein (DUF1111 family)